MVGWTIFIVLLIIHNCGQLLLLVGPINKRYTQSRFIVGILLSGFGLIGAVFTVFYFDLR